MHVNGFDILFECNLIAVIMTFESLVSVLANSQPFPVLCMCTIWTSDMNFKFVNPPPIPKLFGCKIVSTPCIIVRLKKIIVQTICCIFFYALYFNHDGYFTNQGGLNCLNLPPIRVCENLWLFDWQGPFCRCALWIRSWSLGLYSEIGCLKPGSPTRSSKLWSNLLCFVGGWLTRLWKHLEEVVFVFVSFQIFILEIEKKKETIKTKKIKVIKTYI